MPTREDLIEHLWQEIINPLDGPSTLDNIIANCRRQPDATFSGIGPGDRARPGGRCLCPGSFS
jgi:hypothetical protein